MCDQNHCNDKSCEGCFFCTNAGDTCELGTFVDVTSTLFQKEDTYWHQWLHSGRPYLHWGTPVFVDLNDDGILDYFNSMHAHYYSVKDGFNKRMELGESVPNSFTKDGIPPIANESALQRLRPVSERIIIDDDPNSLLQLDPHGQNIVDLDGDGILDILVSSGGGEGLIKTSIKTTTDNNSSWNDNFLLWGEKVLDTLTGKTVTFFRGGREAARKAGVHMQKGRGRINYLLDVNGDGLLDIFCLQDRRISNDLTPGILLINQGNRVWKEDPSMSEFTRSMILTDADGDGFAQEIMLSRSFCFPAREGPDTDQNFAEYGPFPKHITTFCSTRPVGSTAVYKFNPDINQMDEISSKYSNIGAENSKQPPCCPHGTRSGSQDCNAISMASADFDGDLLADHVILFLSKMVFYFSKDRAEDELPGGNEHIGIEINFPAYCSSAISVHIVDLDNDGVEEILVMCKTRGTFLVYRKGTLKRNWILDNNCNTYGSMGALHNITLTGSTEQDLEELCSAYDHNYLKLKEVCDAFEEDKIPPNPKAVGICLVDLDNDGFLDAVVSHHFGYLRFLKNVPPETSLNRFITFSVKGDGKSVNLNGIGAAVILYMKRGRKITNQFREVSSYQHTSDKHSCKDDRIIFGLGQEGEPVGVMVRWPNGIQQKWDLGRWEFSGEVNPIQLALSDLAHDNI